MRRAQVTVFVILGILLLFVSGVVIYQVIKNKITDIEEQHPVDVERLVPIKNYVDQCLTDISREALRSLGDQGRLYPHTYIYSDTALIAYFYYKGDGYFPYQISFIESDVSRYIQERLPECVSKFTHDEYSITKKDRKLEVKTVFNEFDVTIKAHYPIVVKVDDSQVTVSDFVTELNIRFPPIYQLSKEIFKKTKADPEWIDIDFLYQQPYKISLIKLDESTIVYEITDNDYGFERQPYTYRFAMKYDLA